MVDNEGGIPLNESIVTPKNREPLTGEETAQIVAKIYELLSPTNGCVLVEPTAVY